MGGRRNSFKKSAIYFSPHLWVVKCLKFPRLVKDNHTNQFAWRLSLELQLFRCKTWAIVYLKTPASWMNPRRDKESWGKSIQKERGIQGSSGMAYVLHCPPPDLSGRLLFGKAVLKTGRKSFKAGAPSLHPASQHYLNRLVHLLDKWKYYLLLSQACRGPSWMFFLTLYQKRNWQPAPRRQCNMTCSFKEPLISIPSPFWDTIAYFYTLNTSPLPFLGECRKRNQISVGAFEYEVGEICKCICI